MKNIFFISVSIFICYSQTVQTLAKSALINDGLFVGASGTIYTTVGGLRGGTAIGKVTQNGHVSKLSDGFKGTIDVYTRDEILFYATNYDDNSLKSYTKTNNNVETLTSKLDGPASIAVDENNNLYITNFGAPPTYAGQSISVFNPQTNELNTFIDDKRLFRPQGIVYDKKAYFYITNTPNGKVFKLTKKTKTLNEFTYLNTQIGNIQMKGKTLFASSNKGSRIYVIDLDGNFMSFSGDGQPNTKDGSIEDAQFLSPLGLAFSPDEQTLYVAQAKDGALRAIKLGNYSFQLQKEFKKANIFTTINPTDIILESTDSSFFNLQIHTIEGKSLAVLHSKPDEKITHIDTKEFERPFILSFEKGKKRFGIKIN